MTDKIFTISAEDLKYYDGTIQTLYSADRPSHTMGCNLFSLEKLAEDIVYRQAVYVIDKSYVNKQGFEVKVLDVKNPLPESLVRQVKRGLYQEEWENLQKLLSEISR